MNCQRCASTITEQAFSFYRGRCMPCFNRLFIRRFKSLCSDTVPFLLVLFFVIFVIPVAAALDLLLRLWKTIARVPFRRSVIIDLMTPHFGLAGAIEYANGLKKGFDEGALARVSVCGTHTIRKPKKIPEPSLCYTVGCEDGKKLRRNSKRLQQILDLRCSTPFQSNSKKPKSPNSDRHCGVIKLGRILGKHTRGNV